tara:strand:+ start:620 stop:778 length:159 start_codon:yes stop_codon:yes gene_type:complete
MVTIEEDIYIYGGRTHPNETNEFLKILGYTYFTGEIADLRLYNYAEAPEALV